MEPSQFLKGRTRETKISRDAGGRWFNDGDAIDHPNLVRSFAQWVDRAEDGRFCLSNDINWAYIAIEGPAYFVVDATIGEDGITLQLSGDRSEKLAADSLREDEHGALWCAVREGRCPARFENHAATKLADLIGEDAQGMHLTIADVRYYPTRIDNPTQIGK